MSENDILTTVGIDVGSSAIKVAVMRDDGQGDETMLAGHAERLRRRVHAQRASNDPAVPRGARQAELPRLRGDRGR